MVKLSQQLQKITLKKTFTLNGKKWNKTFIPNEAVANGGELVFVLGDKPNKSWGTAEDSIPPSISGISR
jgi:putative alpha-1,2-mannosidase